MELNDLQPGDTVIYSHMRTCSVEKIDRITPSQIIIGPCCYNRRSGRMVGGDSRSPSISVPKDGEVERVRSEARKQFLVRKLRYLNWSALTLEQLEQVAASVPVVAANPTPNAK